MATTSFRPTVTGNVHAVSSGQYLATAAGFRILEQGGNAVDAGVAAGIAINVVLPASTSFGGVAPILIYSARDNKVHSISGLGRWPAESSAAFFIEQRGGKMAPGVERVVVPAAAHAWMTALIEHGTMSFEQVVTPALELSRDGFIVSQTLANNLAGCAEYFDQWPTSAAIYAPKGHPLQQGEVSVNSALARTFERLIETEKAHAHLGREEAIDAARTYFYEGPVAEELVAFVREAGGFLSMDDMATFQAGHEPPVSGSFHEYEVFTNGPWCQGPVFAETLQMLAGDDLAGLGHNSADYIHLVAEALKLSFADRDAYYGDPDHVDVPIAGLLDAGYTTARRGEIDMARATPAMPAAGDPWPYEGRSRPADYAYEPPPPIRGTAEPDTSYACAVDRWGNMFSVTPSDTLSMAPVAPSLGFTPSGRGTQSWLDPRHPSVLAPGKRPRLTPNALLAFKDGKPWMPFGTPGGDAQCQATLQFFLNMTVFGMTPQQAIEAPRFLTWSFPNSFWPHSYEPGRLDAEGRISSEVVSELEARGHDVSPVDAYSRGMGDVCGIATDRTTKAVAAGADLRADAYAMAR